MGIAVWILKTLPYYVHAALNITVTYSMNTEGMWYTCKF